MNREEKQNEIAFLESKLKSAQIALIANYQGLSVRDITTLRKSLSEKGAGARVTKNTLAKLAAKKTIGVDDQAGEFEKFYKQLEGPTLLIYSDVDPVSPAKVVQEFSKTKEIFAVRGAWVDGAFVDQKGIEALSKMPGKEELLATLLRLIQTPATQLVQVLSAPSRNVVQVINAQKAKLES